ncbi:hypothetical protein MRB53_032467 [Persea americana]|uniref:Uncharacterized protein n=1 Tax=Persea americana TaxID=3435 RepID=A0ACC2KRZ6_PERAE|nr:hypothetical protein MRB53_032467 [Persea americana]
MALTVSRNLPTNHPPETTVHFSSAPFPPIRSLSLEFSSEFPTALTLKTHLDFGLHGVDCWSLIKSYRDIGNSLMVKFGLCHFKFNKALQV